MSKSRFYLQGYSDGREASYDTDWRPGEMERADDEDETGEVAGQILEHWQQMADTIYYDDSVTERQLDRWEEGFYAGFAKGVREQLKTRRKNPRKRKR